METLSKRKASDASKQRKQQSKKKKQDIIKTVRAKSKLLKTTIAEDQRDADEIVRGVISGTTSGREEYADVSTITRIEEHNDNNVGKNNNNNSKTKVVDVFTTKNLPSSSFLSVSTNVISTYIRTQFSTATTKQNELKDVLSSGKITSELQHNFHLPRPLPKGTNNPSTRRLSTESINNDKQQNLFNNLHRCLVEDFMKLKKGREIVVVLPKDDERFQRYEPDGEITFGKKEYRMYNCFVSTSSYAHYVVAGIAITDLKKGFNEGKFGSFIDISNPSLKNVHENSMERTRCNTDVSICVTWSEVLNARENGLQVWRELTTNETCPNFYSLFKSKRRTDLGCRSILNYFYSELYGDRIQLYHLYSSYFRSRNLFLSSVTNTSSGGVRETNTTSDEQVFDNMYNEVKLSGEDFSKLCNRIDAIYERAIKRSFDSFLPFDQPILLDAEVTVILADYMNTLPQHFAMLNQMMMFNNKTSRTRNEHLAKENYYNKKLLFMFLSQARMVNNHNLVHFGMVIPGASYSRGISSKSLVTSVYNGSSITYDTLMKKLKTFNKDMDKNMQLKMKDMLKFVVIMDNNQKGFPRKHQRSAVSNDYIVVTGRTFRYCNEYTPEPHVIDIVNRPESRVNIEYIDQDIPSMSRMPSFELYMDDTSMISKILLSPNTFKENANTIDFSGSRIRAYHQLIDIHDVNVNVMFRFFTNYKLTTNQYKRWEFCPDVYESEQRKKQSHIMSVMKANGTYNTVKQFQSNVCSIVDPGTKEVSKIFCPCVSERDEITTSGYGMAIIEVLEYVGILEQHRNEVKDVTEWNLSQNYDKKTVYLCVDGLSLDRHRSFKRRLTKIKHSFHDSFQQSMRFQLALNRVIEISGPLHVAFHMLQSIFDTYTFMMKWGIELVQWKRIKATKISECFQLAREFIFVLLNECERYLIDVCYHEYMTENERNEIIAMKDDFESSIIISKRYIEFLNCDNNSWSANDENRKMIISFTLAVRSFRKYWTAIRNGDKQMQEYIMNQWIGVFGILGKHNYLDICLNTIEKEYGEIPYTSLEELRRNCYVRRNKGNDLNGVQFSCSALDEIQEEINHDVKQLPINGEKNSWIQHSKNVVFGMSCRNFVDKHYVRRHLTYVEENETGQSIVQAKNNSRIERVHTNIPSCTPEKIRIYEFLVKLLFHESNDNPVDLDYRRGEVIITKLKTSLKKDCEMTNEGDTNNTDTSTTDTLRACLDRLFTLNTSDNTGTTESVESDENPATSNTGIHPRKQLATSNIFKEGMLYLSNNNIVELRKRRRNRLERDMKYFIAVDDMVNENLRKMDLTLTKFDGLSSNTVSEDDEQPLLPFQLDYDNFMSS